MQLRDWLSWEKLPEPKAVLPEKKYRPLRDWLDLDNVTQEKKPVLQKGGVNSLSEPTR